MRLDRRRVRIGVLAAALVLAAGCAEPYDRVAVAGIVVPMAEPLPSAGTTLQPLPPAADVPEPADTADGSILVEVDEQRVLLDRGTILPAWVPPHEPRVDRDPTLAAMQRVVEDLATVRRLLDALFTAPGVTRPGTQRSTPAASQSDAPATPAEAQAALLLPPEAWAALVTRVVRLSAAIDHLVTQERRIGPDGHVVPALDGDAMLARRRNEIWQGMESLATTLVADAGALAADGTLGEVRRHGVHGPELEPLLGAIATSAAAIAGVIRTREAPALIPTVRLLEHRLDALEAAPSAELVYGMPAPPEAPTTARLRDCSRVRLARLRRDLVAVAAQWAANGARLMTTQPTPLLVYERDAPAAVGPTPATAADSDARVDTPSVTASDARPPH